MSDGAPGVVREVPVVEPTEDVPVRGRPGRRRSMGIGLVVLLCLVTGAIAVTARPTSSPDERKAAHTSKTPARARSARVRVGAALAATVAARNYRISSVMRETAAPGYSGRVGPTLRSNAVVNVAPLAMVATSDVAGGVTSWSDSTKLWEQGGANYGLTASSGMGPGMPISGFANSVIGTLGPREGGVGMMGLASPNGHLDTAGEAISAATEVGSATLDGSHLTEYEVALDLPRLANQSGMSAEQIKTATGGLGLLQQEHYASSRVRLGVDDAGYVREAHTVWTFADGGAVTVDTTYSDYGCAGTIVLPTATAAAPPPAATCSSPDPAATSPSSTIG